ncbi:hepatic leukemia factor [Nasonia vitripennis]|uniref:BZIP domain-containing protein n=1 Tax=Nasonia vitripennis TaxID=7425 RepID=A0A7M7IVC6_NASVI|nr:hepatic leukemia factor [Nasonia vitripennis]
MGSQSNNRTISEGSFSDALSALQLLRSYNNLITPNSDVHRYDSYSRAEYSSRDPETTRTSAMLTAPLSPLAPSAPFTLTGLLQPPLLAAMPPLVPPVNISHPFTNASAAAAMSRNIIENAVISSMHQSRRPRSEKKPIPDEQKDDKYYERRKRNNQAAKKSRDARKIREDHIALRATMLEHENAILRAQVVTLREECQSLRQMLIKQRMPSMQSVDQLTDRSISSSVTLTPANSVTSLPCPV